jgi:hypothetical protein
LSNLNFTAVKFDEVQTSVPRIDDRFAAKKARFGDSIRIGAPFGVNINLYFGTLKTNTQNIFEGINFNIWLVGISLRADLELKSLV